MAERDLAGTVRSCASSRSSCPCSTSATRSSRSCGACARSSSPTASSARSSSSTTAATTAHATCSSSSATARCASILHDAQPRARARRCAPASSTRPATTCSSRTPTSSTTPRTGRDCSRRCSRGKARVVYGSRFTGERRNMLFLHWVGNRFLSLVTNVLYNTTLSDMETCYKLVDRALLDELDLHADRFDIEPEITAKILKRKVRIYEVPISYTGREFDEGKKITWTRRLRGAVDAREVPLPRLVGSPPRAGPCRVGRGGRQLRSRAAADAMRRVGARRHERRAGRARRRRQRLARRLGRRAASARIPDVRVVRSPGNVGYARAANLGIAATRRRIVAVLNPDTAARAGRGGRARRPRSMRRAALAAVGPRMQNLDGTDYPSARVDPVDPRSRSMHGALGLWWPTNPFTTTYRQLDADPDAAAARRLGVRRRGLAAPGRARRRRRLGRAVLHVPRGRRSVLAAAAVRAGRSRTSRPGVVWHVQGASTARRPVPDARRAPPLGVALRPPPVHRRACRAAAVRGRVPGRARRAGDGRARAGTRTGTRRGTG